MGRGYLRGSVLVLVGFSTLLHGCGEPVSSSGAKYSGPAGKVSGKVTLDGKEVLGGTVVFVVEVDKVLQYARGEIKNGQYEAENVPTGLAKVYLELPPFPPGFQSGPKPPEVKGAPKLPAPPTGVEISPEAKKMFESLAEIPPQYLSPNESGLNVRVKTDSTVTLNIPLKKK